MLDLVGIGSEDRGTSLVLGRRRSNQFRETEEADDGHLTSR